MKVTLEGDGVTLETTSGAFGDFAFERLPRAAAYTVTVAHDGYVAQSCDVKTHTDVDLGEVVLAKERAARDLSAVRRGARRARR